MSTQPQWKIVANLGDVDYVENGGMFVLVDESGYDTAQMEILVEPADDEDALSEQWTVYRFDLERFKIVPSHESQYLVPYECNVSWPHPVASYRPWFDRGLGDVASSSGVPVADLMQLLCSEEPKERAQAYRALAGYYGNIEFDQEPLSLNRDEVEARYAEVVR